MIPDKPFYLHSLLIQLVLAFFLMLNLGCKKSPTEIDKPPVIITPPSLELSVDGVSCTEAWIKVKKLNDTTFLAISLKINEKEFFNGFLAAMDTVLFVDSLTPSTTYTIKGIVFDTIKEITITTLPTTSHNFTWQTFTFGEYSNSSLNDVAIINENNIWAVGEIYLKDSLGNEDPRAYNAVHWDGNNWELKRIYYYGACSAVQYPPLSAIWAFSDSNIVITNGGSIGWFDGKKIKLDCGVNPLLTGAINSMWGTSSSDLYVVGNKGSIAHYNGKTWLKIESQTTLNIFDIWGDYNKRTQDWELLAVASNYGTGYEKEILQIIVDKVEKLSTSTTPTMEPLLCTWFIPNMQYYVVGAGIYQKRKLSESFWQNNLFTITTYSTTSICGNGINDVIGVGAYGDVVHYNGVNWKNNYSEPRLGSGSYSEVKIKGNLVVSVGSNNRKAVILIGKR